jgi:glycosyltransferase involved in cell wall biosynthesis
VLARDEERNLPHALGSVPRGSALLVIDAESKDATVACARSYGASVVVRPWAGFVATRRFALGLVDTEWTFMLDADERLDDDLRRSLIAATPPDDVAGLRVRRINYFCGRPLRAGAWGRDRPLRLFRTARASLVAAPASGGNADVHERWTVEGSVDDLPGALLHDSYPTIESYRKKFARYTSIEAAGLSRSTQRLARSVVEFVPRAAFSLFVRGGVLDGWRGAFVALASASYPVVASWKALRARER